MNKLSNAADRGQRLPLSRGLRVVSSTVFGILLAELFGSACYTYQPLETPAPRIGAEVRAQLATPISVRIGEMTLNDVNRVEGQVYQTQGDSVIVWGEWVYTRLGSRYAANGGALLIDRHEGGTLQVRRLAPVRSGVAGVAAVGVVFVLFRLVESAFGGGGSGGPPPEPN